MKPASLAIACVLAVTSAALAQEVIPLYAGTAPGSPEANYPEKQYSSKVWNTEVVSNITKPTLTLYRAVAGGNGTAVVVCPGGGFMALSVNSEGIAVAKWLADRGVTAFVLKYRVVHTGEDATEEFRTRFSDRKGFDEFVAKTEPLSIADGLAAVAYVRKHASDWGIFADRVGIIGFSAGGTVTAGVGFRYAPEGRPAFLAPIYAAVSILKDDSVPPDAPPMFLAAATDDGLGLAPDSISLYNKWAGAHKSVELHMYATGGHGFGMKKQGFPSDEWIDRFADWLGQNGWMKR
jgi:acetyl esterase/lipase